MTDTDQSLRTSTTAIVGLVLAFLLPPVGLIVSLAGLPETAPGIMLGRGIALAGITISGVAVLIFVLAAVFAG